MAVCEKSTDIRGRTGELLWTALIGGLVCGTIGPGLPLLPDYVFPHAATKQVADLPMFWLLAVMTVGAPAFLLGAACALTILSRSRRTTSVLRLCTETLVLGVVLGACVVLAAALLWRTPQFVTWMPAAMFAGPLCSVLVLWMLSAAKLLAFRRGSPSRPGR